MLLLRISVAIALNDGYHSRVLIVAVYALARDCVLMLAWSSPIDARWDDYGHLIAAA